MIDRESWRERIRPRFARPQDSDILCDEGWRELICELVEALDATGVRYKIAQIKEKFGGLRFYVNAPLDAEAFHALIEKAEARSFTICETCGKPGEPRGGAWIRTLCVECHTRGAT